MSPSVAPRRTVLVTGAARGIGRAIADRFLSAGYAVLTPTRAELNLAEPASIENFIRDGSLGLVDVLINNAAENIIAPIVELQAADWQRMVQTNLSSCLSLIAGVVPGMTARGFGRIVNMSSSYSLVSRPGRAGYAMTKAGLNGLTRTAALEYAPAGILVNAICPGFVETEMTSRNNGPAALAELCTRIPLGRLGRPEEIAELTFFLGSEHNTYITGQAIPIEGGFLCQ